MSKFTPVDSCACCTGMPTEFHESLAEIAFKASICGLASKGCIKEEMEEAMYSRVLRLTTDIRSVTRKPQNEETTQLSWDRLCAAHELVLKREVPRQPSEGPALMTVAEGFRCLFSLLEVLTVKASGKGEVPVTELMPGINSFNPSSGMERATLFYLCAASTFLENPSSSSARPITTPDDMLSWLVTYACGNQYSPSGTPPVLYAVRHVRPSTLNILLDSCLSNPFIQAAGLGDTALHRVATEGYDNTAESLLDAIIATGVWWEERRCRSQLRGGGGGVVEGGGAGRRLVEGFVNATNVQGRTAVVHLEATMVQKGITPDISRHGAYLRIKKLIEEAPSKVVASG